MANFLSFQKESVRHYRSKNGRHYFTFKFVNQGGHIDIYCTRHPSLRGRSTTVIKTHLYSSGLVCFTSGREPQTQRRAEILAKQFSEYLLEYIRTGKAQK